MHTVFRGPKGGTLRVIRSQLGRADPAQVDKAARLAGVPSAQFWSWPQPQATPASPPDITRAAAASTRRKRAAHDSVVSLVLAIHAQADRQFSSVLGRSRRDVPEMCPTTTAAMSTWKLAIAVLVGLTHD